MRKDFLFGVLFFGSLWGFFEMGLGGILYAEDVPYASVPLTLIGLMLLTIAKVYLPQKNSAMCIGAIAMLYKFINTPFYGCHLLGIFLMGFSYDVAMHTFKIKNKALLGVVTTYLGYVLFAFTITYVFRYHHWITQGMPKIIHYLGTSGTFTAIGSIFIVPACVVLGERLREKAVNPFEFKSRLATSSASLIILTLWMLGATQWFRS